MCEDPAAAIRRDIKRSKAKVRRLRQMLRWSVGLAALLFVLCAICAPQPKLRDMAMTVLSIGFASWGVAVIMLYGAITTTRGHVLDAKAALAAGDFATARAHMRQVKAMR